MLDGAEALEVPPDLRTALGKRAGARRNFDGFPPSARRALLGWIAMARTPATRARRVADTAKLAEENRRPR
jgi:uncharacterized protein YdeI (YjbR/CyaY-like superfamily)